ncbi:acetyl-CoA carboxylase, carboxyltransferase subunit beta [Clostridium algidicarnis]|uniref:acetyl-CoA carboxylase, carboxyltransferase subunit beta n=1 Tax=Clostridium algidicarnis TaxID=37659 RepID=UPI0016276AF4|nr:acetyl-CoA carboxylase, carboxyltransferase subunit beta [Clostridium algidicarnis]MBB6630309.1 acetyl-CoA carboxylase carboxyltransferase subunit beta [Clostridium algidicarnis]MBB6697728.1 acetyl-CoA carboxylase carboxyltransferase subunit beta [Clostridium algidicarnis]MBU3192874.1 acetyl-CoA carboxylase, carboxyltransferase subunit beta [Clostridium algidicarnis]MBU3203535.1 acetyl-CoA carboxylase, carboxyltransferase subunit beta [Clostridium algidicarnis]MBU3206153.1 acetyl-CoA carbox
MNLFKKRKYITVSNLNLENSKDKAQQLENTSNIPEGMWVKCEGCGKVLYKKDVEKKNKICIYCGYHFRMTPKERIELTIDKGTFEEFDKDMKASNPLDYPKYEEKIFKMEQKTGNNEGVVTGKGKIQNEDTVIAVMDSNFIMGSMGTVVGEKITRAIEYATLKKLPMVIFTASGGARMQEGIFSLMQMAKTASALGRHNESGLLYITVLTDPTTGGITASFAMLGDIILAEPDALVGFAGRRVIEQTIKQELPKEFQKAEFLLHHGFIDKIVKRDELKETLGRIIKLHSDGE